MTTPSNHVYQVFRRKFNQALSDPLIVNGINPTNGLNIHKVLMPFFVLPVGISAGHIRRMLKATTLPSLPLDFLIGRKRKNLNRKA